MKNVSMEIKDKKLIVTVDLSKDFGPSSSGKSRIVASTEGNADVPGHTGTKIGLNVYKKA
jgi:hypothetical protein